MREIKFRAWMKACPEADLNEDYMIDWSIVSDDPQQLGQMIRGEYQECIKLMQFTGLKDKNGKEIYEGDIIKYEDKKDRNLIDDGIYEIFWFESGWGLRLIYDEGGYSDHDEPAPISYPGIEMFDEAKIIGNIYENPELL